MSITSIPTLPLSSPQPSPYIPLSPSHVIGSQPVQIRSRNPKYYSDKFINVTTNHPMPASLEPSTVTQAMKDPLWHKAMYAEFNALLQNGT